MNRLRSLTHLARRAASSLSNRPPAAEEVHLAREVLTDGEFDLWSTMDGRDRRHSLEVLRRFDGMCPNAQKSERAAALLHDVGKVASGLGWSGRVMATLVGPRTRRMRLYLDHERLGGEMLLGMSPRRTIELVSGDADDAVSAKLRDADNL